MNSERLIRFQHPQKVLGYLGRLGDDRIANLFGLDVDVYRRTRQAYGAQARDAATDLLADPGFAAKVDRLPFKAGQRVMAIGESTTGDLLSWFEILRHLLDLRRPADAITLINTAVSGQTTTQALAALPGLCLQRPDWVLCMLGANDVQRLRSAEEPADGPTLVSLAETERNLRALRELTARRTAARRVWLTPPTVDEARVAAYPPFQHLGITWANHDIDAVGHIVTRLPDVTVDTRPVIAGRTAEPFHTEDGLHLSLTGQRALAAALVDALADAP
ncbi:SGNH/GDSL hydrolase family protein [Streptosporangium sandarakinum]